MRNKPFAILFVFLSGLVANAQEKPALTAKDLESNTYYFGIADNKLTGDGARFLTAEIAQSQFVLLGEYHGSRRISEFTRAIIPVFDAAGCRTFGLEIGPVSAEILSELSKDPARTIENLNAFNTKNLVAAKSRAFTPIPFFGGREDAEFLIEARARKWNLLGLDQEFAFGYIPLVERMYDNLDAKKKRELKPLFEKTTALIGSFYEASLKENKSRFKAFADSKEVNEFLDAAAAGNPKNRRIADALRLTNGIYYMNDDAVRKYYEANAGRIDYMKKNLAEGFARLRFDLKKDKMLLKMGGGHTVRGFSDLSLYEIGNTLSELAAFNGNRSLHLEFGSRYFIEDDREVDALSDPKGFLYRYQALLQMSKKDLWTIVDLRPLRKAVFYQRKFNLDPLVLEMFKNQDLFIIAPTDRDPTPNYAVKN